MRILTTVSVLFLLFSQACSLTAGEEKQATLQRVIGDKSMKNQSSFYQLCQVGQHQIPSDQDVQQLIEDAAEQKISTAYLFRAFSPSFRYEVQHDGKKILLLEGASSMQTRQGQSAKKLISLIDQLCSAYDSKAKGRGLPTLPSGKTKK